MGKIESIQTILGVKADGLWGPKSQAALDALLSASPVSPLADARSEGNIATLHPKVQPKARQLLEKFNAMLPAGYVAKIISGTRTYDQQDALYAKGRTAAGSKVTNARGGYSNHNFGVAFDIGLFNGTSYLGESPFYRSAGQVGKSIGLEWGGDWKSFRDEPHFQLRPGWAKGMSETKMLAEMRRLTAAGEEIA